ncbi:4Fe-4S dicluster domain-containing protein [Sphaerotilus montanus]|uniref:NAD-dependent dihydropyrimidine dehydrogenase PreA subunit n=1 Tax=Sphaerotilus montanus TaxID=522889 RepID=A0A7Y9QZJ9_9BURK|nr:4Fe-4S dicluster domain-containing protein [Sphaerotilus montanus]NYG32177.1 NAD-dependent dihydropyrimidine dehydrogenase PreA subunit [Sphaerotilus montanus]NZD56414.1 4Fe-4S dicluster domain-containing protein [Sphaerotilus montanus]
MPIALPRIDPARCTGCGWCIAVCPPHVLSLQVVQWKKRSVLDDTGGCTGCAQCAVRCPFGAIRMHKVQPPDSSSSTRELDRYSP